MLLKREFVLVIVIKMLNVGSQHIIFSFGTVVISVIKN